MIKISKDIKNEIIELESKLIGFYTEDSNQYSYDHEKKILFEYDSIIKFNKVIPTADQIFSIISDYNDDIISEIADLNSSALIASRDSYDICSSEDMYAETYGMYHNDTIDLDSFVIQTLCKYNLSFYIDHYEEIYTNIYKSLRINNDDYVIYIDNSESTIFNFFKTNRIASELLEPLGVESVTLIPRGEHEER